MRRTISLDGGDWTVEGFLGLDAAARVAERAVGGTSAGGTGEAHTGEAPADRPGAIPASVPGSILADVARAGLVADPYVGRNSLAAEWVPERAWLYRRRVRAPGLGPGRRAWLAFEGLDHAGAIYWDGTLVGRHEGMFVPFEVDLTAQLGGTDEEVHELAVVVEPAPASEPQLGRTSRVRVHKSRMGYGWDFCPRMVHQGLWQSVRLETCGPVRITDAWGRPMLSPDFGAATVVVVVSLDSTIARSVRVEAEVNGDTHARAEAAVDVVVGRSEVRLELDVRDPVLWWPNGLGQPVVHRLDVRAFDGDGRLLDTASVPLGFRTIERIPNAGAPAGARPWTWVVNGRRLYVRGWNWVPLDAQYGVPRPERLRHLVRLAREAHVNLLRVWGGGLIETRAFYDACDAAGILVWQEFAQSSSGTDSAPADDPEYVARMAAEAAAILPLRRNHPSLAGWCGGNELEGPAGPLDEDASPVLAALRDVVAALDPGRAWLPTSPSGPRFANRLDVIEEDPDGLHDVHGPWEHQGLRGQQELYNRGTSLFNSEFGVEGMTNRRTHERLIPEGDRHPPTRQNPVYRHLGDWWINEPLAQASFGGRLGDLETLRRASHHLQADGLRYAVEANRRRAFRNSGSIPWQLNESYPNAWCTSAVDHRGDPKPAYFAVRRAYAPLVVAAAFERVAWGGADGFQASVWAWSDGDAFAGNVEARVVDAAGVVHAAAHLPADLHADKPAVLGSISLEAPLPDVFLLDLRLVDARGAARAGNRYLFGGREDLGPLLDIAPAVLGVEVEPEGDRWEVRLRHERGPAALGIRIEDDRPIEAPGWAEVEDGGFDLLPGELRSVGVVWSDDGGGPERRLQVSGWNVPAMVLVGG